MLPSIVQGLLLGISTGAFCLGACAPALVPYAIAANHGSIKASGWLIIEFLCGRLTAYLLLGIAAVSFGIRFQTWNGMRMVTGIAMALLALLLIGYGVRRNLLRPHGCTTCPAGQITKRVPFFTGLLLGLSPCPPLMLVLSALLIERQLLRGAMLLGTFFLVTTVWILPVMGLSSLSRSPVFRRSAELAILLSGIWFFAQGLMIILV
jgi:sulfite exporter TauE/SafE